MIADIWENSGIYAGVHKDFGRAFAALKKCESLQLPAENNSRIQVDGFEVVVQHYQTQPAANRKFEGHRKNIDIQYMVHGRETIYWSPAVGLPVATEYSVERDHLSYGESTFATPLRLSGGQFAVFFPGDAHKTGCAWQSPEAVTKFIVKVQL